MSGSTKENKNQSISEILIRAMAAFAVVIAVFLAYQSVTRSFYSSKNYDEPIFIMHDTTIVHILLFVAVCAVFFAAGRLLKKCSLNNERTAWIALAAAGVWMTVAGCVFLWEHPYYPVGDQNNIITAARLAAQGDYAVFEPGGLIGLCPQNRGMVFLYEILYRICGDQYYRVGAFIHILYNLGVLAAGFFFLKNKFDAVICRVFYCLFMMLCVPMTLYLPYIYGDLGSICFSMVIFWALSEYEKQMKCRYIVISMLAAAMAMLCRMNTWIVLIAVAIGLILTAAEKKSIRPVIAAFCIVLAAQGAVFGTEKMYEARSGIEAESGIPSILYIAMGLQETDRQPGVYNHYHQTVWVDSDFDVELSAGEALENIMQSIEKFREDHAYAKYFFKKKLRMQWIEPTFEAFYATNSVPEGVVAPLWINELYYGKFHDFVWKSANYYQSIVYIAMLFVTVPLLFGRLYAGKGKQSVTGTGVIPMIAVVGGFLFSIIWENQSRYVLPYYVFLVMYTPVGLYRLNAWFEKLIEYVRAKRGADDGHKEKAA